MKVRIGAIKFVESLKVGPTEHTFLDANMAKMDITLDTDTGYIELQSFFKPENKATTHLGNVIYMLKFDDMTQEQQDNFDKTRAMYVRPQPVAPAPQTRGRKANGANEHKDSQ